MPIKINSFMGRLGFVARQYFPSVAADFYLKFQFYTRKKQQNEYIKYFMNATEIPQPYVVNIETINRCNSTCAFCSANIHDEKRPFAKIREEIFYSIIDQLADWNYRGHVALYGNNEPLLDKRIFEFVKYTRSKLPNSFIFLSTNGLILDKNKLDNLKYYIDQLIINNYSMTFKLHPQIQEIYNHVKLHQNEYQNIDIVIQMRYLKEVLTTRAGTAPNKIITKNKQISETCLLPFTDMWITANGDVGLCCCDNLAKTKYANLGQVPLKAAWSASGLRKARELIATGRQNYNFCRHCDFIDAGFRMTVVRHILDGNMEAAHKAGGHERT